MTPDSAIFVRTPADLVDAAPYVLGFHPTDSLVVIGMAGRRVSFAARYDLPPPGDDDIVHIAAVIAAQAARSVTVIGYGPAEAVDPVILRVLEALDVFRVRVNEALRVHDGRWWSCFCDKSGCCPADGNPCNSGDSVIAAEATFRGHVALPSRQALVAQVAAVEGAEREAMAAASERARERLTGLLTGDDRGERAVRRAGRIAVREAEKRCRAGRPLTDDEVAWLGVLLIDRDVNEYALDRSGAQDWHFRLWTDVLRRVEQPYVPAPACLLGYAAWRDGRGALARVAVDRALMADPRHPMAGLLDEVLGYGIGPHAMTALDSLERRSAAGWPDPQSTACPPGGPGADRGPGRRGSRSGGLGSGGPGSGGLGSGGPGSGGLGSGGLGSGGLGSGGPGSGGPEGSRPGSRRPEGCGSDRCGSDRCGSDCCGAGDGGPGVSGPGLAGLEGLGPEGGGPGVRPRAGGEAGGRERSSPGPSRQELGARASGSRGSRGFRRSADRRLR